MTRKMRRMFGVVLAAAIVLGGSAPSKAAEEAKTQARMNTTSGAVAVSNASPMDPLINAAGRHADRKKKAARQNQLRRR